MFTRFLKLPIAALLLTVICSLSAMGQAVGSLPYTSQDVADDGTPVLIKHLPQWESVRDRATIAASASELKAVLGERSILDIIEFPGGTEAVTAQYDAGKLLIVEYATPQASVEADAKITAKLGRDGTVYRRIGNYNVFVFDAADQAAANALLDEIKYEKLVQWLGANPYIISPERAFVLQTADLFVSTVLIIVMGIGFAILFGIVSGYAFFSIREYKRASTPTFSDAGGITRLNLDGLTTDIVPDRLLKD
ncbi:MAG: hypothetical protein IPL32_06015 [Chloracidobacterium sp.]|nr:hypothetical protein [Chloracidobacterium sp.]